MFETGKRYQHDNAICTLGMHVDKIFKRTDTHVSMRISFFHLKNGNPQYSGREFGYFEPVELELKKEDDWSEYKPEEYKLK